MQPSIVTVTLNPAFDKPLSVAALRLGSLHRVKVGPVVPSGKGINVARVAQAWGYPVTALALAGEGRAELGDFLTSCGVRHRVIPVPGRIRTNIKLLETAHGRMTELNEPGPEVPAAALVALRAELQELCTPGSVAVFSGSLPPGVPVDFYAACARELSARGVRVVVDATGEALRRACCERLYLLKPNRAEAEDLLGLSGGGEVTAAELMQGLLHFGAEHTILTLGAQGALFATQGRLLRTRPPQVEVGSAAGAGDTLLATYLVNWLTGRPFAQCAARATAAGACAARGEGTNLARPADVLQLEPAVQVDESSG